MTKLPQDCWSVSGLCVQLDSWGLYIYRCRIRTFFNIFLLIFHLTPSIKFHDLLRRFFASKNRRIWKNLNFANCSPTKQAYRFVNFFGHIVSSSCGHWFVTWYVLSCASFGHLLTSRFFGATYSSHFSLLWVQNIEVL